MKLFHKILAGFLVILVLLALAAYGVFSTRKAISHDVRQISTHTADELQALANMKQSMMFMQLLMSHLLIDKLLHERKVFNEVAIALQARMEEFTVYLAAARNGAARGVEMARIDPLGGDLERQKGKQQLVDNLGLEYAQLETSIRQYLQLVQAQPHEAKNFYYEVMSENLFNRMLPLLATYHASLQHKVGFESNSIINRLFWVNRLLLFLTGIGIGATLLLGVIISRSIARPLAKLQEATMEAAKGNLDVQVPVRGQDEISALLRSFNQMAEDLKRLQDEQQQTLEALHQSEARLKYLLSASPIVIYTCEPGGRHATTFVSDNVTAKLGYEPDNFIRDPKFWMDHLHPEDALRVRADYPNLFKFGHHSQEYRFHRRDGSFIWIHDELRLVRDEEGKPQEIIGSWIDTTERKHIEEQLRELTISLEQRVQARTAELAELNEALRKELVEREKLENRQAQLITQLEHSNQELNDFAYVVSHDLKAPLRAISSLASWLATDYAERLEQEGKDNLNLLVSRVKRMDRLIDGILQYSRIGRVREEMMPVNLNDVVREVQDLLTIPETTEIKVETPLPTVVGERTRLAQIFQNLLENSLKFLDKPQGEIRIGCVSEDGMWRLSVADNGPGIDEKFFDKIFQIFQTLKPKDELETTGLGLAIVKKIVEQYGGRIWVESHLGQGSTFFFTLPKKVTSD